MASRRTIAFRKPANPDWRPKVGESVFLPCRGGQIGRMRETATVSAVLDDIIRIKAEYSGEVVVREYLVSDLRPIPKKRTRSTNKC